MAEVRKLFFHVSGEYETLPYAEVKAILEAEGFSYRSNIVLPRLLCVEADVKCLSSVANRSCFTKVCGIVILKCEASKEAILRTIEKADYHNLMDKEQTFSVRIKAITRTKVDTKELERAIGERVLRKNRNFKVKLVDPDICLFGIISSNVFVFGRKIYEPSREFLRRKLSVRPFVHPSSISPKLARGMVNLARMRFGDYVLDPFCGTGSILVEVGFIGGKVFGSDISSEMLRGTIRNLSYFEIPWEGLVVSDARYMPFSSVDSIITDPPYGRASSTHGTSTKEIVSNFFVKALDILPRGGYISIALPNTLRIGKMVENLGYLNIEKHLIREHKSLTREISVIQKP